MAACPHGAREDPGRAPRPRPAARGHRVRDRGLRVEHQEVLPPVGVAAGRGPVALPALPDRDRDGGVMKIADKRKVIEVLLCCGQDPSTFQTRETTGGTADALEADGWVDLESNRQWMEVRREVAGTIPHNEVCITAAYRLI